MAVSVEEAFEPKYNLPIVRDRVSYTQLLDDIRSLRVKEIHWFSHRDDFKFEGPCLVEYWDDTVKQSSVPAHDMTIPAAMMTHQVVGNLLPPVPTDTEVNPVTPVSEDILNWVTKLFPIASLIVVYYCVQYMNWLRGDMADRKMMKRKEREAARKQSEEDFAEQEEIEAETLANMGFGVREIVHHLTQSNIPFNLMDVKQAVEKARLKQEQEIEKEKAAQEQSKERCWRKLS